MLVRGPVPERIHLHNITHFDCQISLGETTADPLSSNHCGSITLYRVQCAVEHPIVKSKSYTYYKGNAILCKQHTALNALKSEKSLSSSGATAVYDVFSIIKRPTLDEDAVAQAQTDIQDLTVE